MKAEAFFHLSANFNYPLMCRVVGADGAVHGHPLQHGLVRDAAHRHPAVLRGDGVGGQFLHGLPARAVSADLDRPAALSAVPDVDRHRAGREQHQGGLRGALPQAERVRAHAEVPHRGAQRRVDRQEVPPVGGPAADDRSRAGPLFHRDAVLRPGQRHLRHGAVPDALPGRLPLHRLVVASSSNTRTTPWSAFSRRKRSRRR